MKINACPKCNSDDVIVAPSEGGISRYGTGLGNSDIATYSAICQCCGYRLDFIGSGAKRTAVSAWNKHVKELTGQSSPKKKPDPFCVYHAYVDLVGYVKLSPESAVSEGEKTITLQNGLRLTKQDEKHCVSRNIDDVKTWAINVQNNMISVLRSRISRHEDAISDIEKWK
jgi:hypothetical protein